MELARMVPRESVRSAPRVFQYGVGTRSSLEEAVLATLAYHDLLDLPLTAVQCWRYVLRPRSVIASPPQLLLGIASSPPPAPQVRAGPRNDGDAPTVRDIEAALSELVAAGRIETRNGFYFFPGRADLYETWVQKHARSQRKWHRLRRIVVWLQTIPFLRGVAGTGSLAFDNAKPSSDLDVLVIAAHNRVWTVRFLLTVLLDVLRLRRRPQGPTADRVCLNHYLSDDTLEFPYRSLYTTLEYARLVPLLGEAACREFREANRAWMEQYLVRVFPDSVRHLKTVPTSGMLRAFQRWGEWGLGGRFGDVVERLLARVQRARIARADATTAPGGRVVATDARAEFHPQSREAPLLRAFNLRMEALGLADLFGHQQDSGLTL